MRNPSTGGNGISQCVFFLKKIEKDTDRDYIMTPEEALEYGMIDRVITMDKTHKEKAE